MISREIVFFQKRAKTGCDANCSKAWGLNSRPRHRLSGDEDDFYYLGDDELGEAPEDPGTYEGGHAKPVTPEERLNKWCVRECERNAISDPGEADQNLVLPDWSHRVYNLPESEAAQESR